jgi:hypothetical protein
MKNLKSATRQVGDGKLPNKYWVSFYDDFLYFNQETEGFDWDSERTGRKPEGGTVRVFSTYGAAKRFFDAVPIESYYEGMEVKSKIIEDRLSGEVCEETLHETIRPIQEYHSDVYETLSYTMKEMKRRGVHFE